MKRKAAHPRYKMAAMKSAAQRLETICRQNVQRHEKAAANVKLREEIQRHTANRNMQMELDRLREASLRHSGLDVPGLNRMQQLQKLITS